MNFFIRIKVIGKLIKLLNIQKTNYYPIYPNIYQRGIYNNMYKYLYKRAKKLVALTFYKYIYKEQDEINKERPRNVEIRSGGGLVRNRISP